MTGTKILIVEYKKSTSLQIQRALAKQDYLITDIVDTGTKAIRAIEKEPPDLILMDIMLKGGMDSIQKVTEISKSFDIPTIILTAHREETALDRAIRADPYAYLNKLFDSGALIAAIDVAFYKHQLVSTINESEERYHSLIQSSRDAIVTIDDRGSITFWNRGAERMFQRSEQEMLNKPLNDIIPERFRKRHSDSIKRLRREGYSRLNCQIFDLVGLRGDGSEFPLELTLGSWRWGTETFYSGIIRDVTERKREKETLELFSLAIEQSSNMIVITDAEGVIKHVNPAFTRTTGYSLEEARNNTPRIIKSDTTLPKTHAMMWKTIKAGHQWRGELQNRRKDGSLYWVSLNISPMVYPNGTIANFVGISTDITERKGRDDILLASKTEAESANRAKTMFLANMSHELRTPLNSIIGFSELLLATPGADIDKRDYRKFLNIIHDCGEHLLGIITEIMEVSMIETGEIELVCCDVDLAKTIDTCMNMLIERSTKAGLALSATISGDMAAYYCDELKVKQILINVLSNAIKFTPPEGKVALKAEANDRGEIVIEVSDTGIGISPKNVPKVTEPFFQAGKSTAHSAKGTGLGLVISKRLIELHGGTLDIDSKLGKGTTVTLVFPNHAPLNVSGEHDAQDGACRRRRRKQHDPDQRVVKDQKPRNPGGS